MNQKLLHRTLRSYLLISIVILVVIAPLFYGTIGKLYIDDADEALLLHKNEFLHYYQPTFKENEIANWNRYNRDIKIEKQAGHVASDTIYFQKYLDTLVSENEPYR